jgi:peptidoglycan/LPS O-acetylase OafA/YrhL
LTLTTTQPATVLTDDAPPTQGRRIPYEPSLDGFRGLAVGAVVLYHGGVSVP